MYADGVDMAPGRRPARRRTGRRGRGVEPDVLLGWVPDGPAWLATGARAHDDGRLRAAAAVADGRLRYLPVRLSAVPGLLRDALSRRRGGDRGPARRRARLRRVGRASARPRAGRRSAVVVEVDPHGPDLGGPPIEADRDRRRRAPGGPAAAPSPAHPRRSTSPSAGGSRQLLPDGATIQLGPGRHRRRHRGEHRAARVGVVGSRHRRGGRAGRARPAPRGRDRRVHLGRPERWPGWPPTVASGSSRSTRRTIAATLASIERFVACNTAVQVGLDGAVNVERVGGRQVAGIGGHADFAAGASRSPGGISLVALRSTTRRRRVDDRAPRGGRLDAPLRHRRRRDRARRRRPAGLDDAERARRLVEVAAPAAPRRGSGPRLASEGPDRPASPQRDGPRTAVTAAAVLRSPPRAAAGGRGETAAGRPGAGGQLVGQAGAVPGHRRSARSTPPASAASRPAR